MKIGVFLRNRINLPSVGLIVYFLVAGVFLAISYRVVGRFLVRSFALDPDWEPPSVTMRDGIDYEPISAAALLPQHFSAIAAAGPIVGPILAGMYFGWLPATLWILLGCVFIGGIHDFATLIASVRHRARSIAEVVKQHMNPRAHVLFLLFVWMSLVYVIIAFADVTAGTFLSTGTTDAPGPAVASSSTIYLLLAVVMGLALRFTKIGPVRAKLIFLPLVLAAILIGPYIPLDISGAFGEHTKVAWNWLLLSYCFAASLIPVWLLLQPRGELGGYFLYAVMGVAVVGIVVGGLASALTGGHSEVGLTIVSPAFKGWNAPIAAGGAMLFPVLFITIACGACSGFHSIVASGTTSKQLRNECDAKPVAYGSMLLEGFFACISLATVMVVAKTADTPNMTYAQGIAQFGHSASFGVIPTHVIIEFGLLCFATFVFDTLDACTRLARYCFMELVHKTDRSWAVFATIITLALPFYVTALPPVLVQGKPMPLFMVFWSIFGTSNQLLAALTLLGLTVWMYRTGKSYWITLAPMVFMMVMTFWSLSQLTREYWSAIAGGRANQLAYVQFAVTVILAALAVWLILEAVGIFLRFRGQRVADPGLAPQLAAN